MMAFRFTCLVSLLTLAIPAKAADIPLEAVRLHVRPAAEPKPALSCRLMPELREMTHGNGAIQYYRAYSPEWLTHTRQPDWNKFHEYLTMPLKDLPREKLQWLLKYGPLKELDVASRKESCDWDLTDRLRQDGIGLLLPDMQGFREMATLLGVKARLQMAEGHYEQALYTLQTGMVLGKRVGEAPTLICHLVGTAIVTVMLGQVEELMQVADVPNLYWALSELPRPMIDIRKSLESERIWLDGMIPQLKQIEASLKAKEVTPLSPEEQQALTNGVADLLTVAFYFEGPVTSSAEHRRLTLAAFSLKAYPAAKKALIAQGHDPKKVNALPVIQVVTMRALQVYLEMQDDLQKWFGLPYADREEGLARAEKSMREAKARMDVLPFFELLPAVAKVSFAQARLDRRIAALRCIEAVRLYAAGHEGKLPQSLDMIKDVPVPADPVTGKAFEYTAEGNKVTLFGRAPAKAPGKAPASPGSYVLYELTFVR
jgi:hypothetical protein